MKRCHLLINFVLRLPSALMMRARVVWWRLLGMRVGPRCWLQQVWVPRNPWEIEIEGNTAIDKQVTLLATGVDGSHKKKICIRSGTYINRFTMLDASERIEIGHHCMIGPHCYITDHDHGHAAGVLIHQQALISAPVEIGDEVWLGAGVIVLKGVTIGRGAVVAAGSVVTKNIEAGKIAAGVPAREIGERKHAHE